METKFHVELLKTKKEKRTVKQVNMTEAVGDHEKHTSVKQEDCMVK